MLFPRRRFTLGLIVTVALSGAPGDAMARGPGDRPRTDRADKGDRGEKDPFASATAAVVGHRSEKVRVHAALVLGRTRDGRAVPFLIRALADPSPTVRAMAARALGNIADAGARAPLEVAALDSHPLVRRHASQALEALQTAHERQSHAAIAVKTMGDKTSKASVRLLENMRGFVEAELRGFGAHGRAGYTVDGAIKTLSMSGRADLIEVRCGVELVLSTGANAIVLMSTGEAVVQRQRRQFRPAMHPSMEMEALQHAVRGASAELRQHFAANRP